VFCIFILASLAEADQVKDSVEYYLKEGGDAYANNDYPAAIAAFKKVLEFDSLNTNALKPLGVIYSETNRIGLAMDYFKKAIAIDSTDAAAYNSLGITYLVLSDTAKAIENYNRAISLDSTRGNFAANLALLYFADQDYNKAIGILQPVVKHDTTSARAYYFLGRSYMALKRNVEAEPYLEKAAELDSRSTEYVYYLAVVKDFLGKANAAETGYKETIAKEPDNFEAYQRLGVLYIKTDRNLDAISMFERAAAIKPGDLDANIALGAAHMRAGHADKAEEIRQWLEQRNPQAAAKMTRLGQTN
jgi:Flp pilus assembly protein TadD